MGRPWAEPAWLSLWGRQVLSPIQRLAQELWLPHQLQLSWKRSRISFSTFYLEMCRAVGIYELPKIQSRGHKLEVHSHVCSDCSFLKKRFSFEQFWQEESLGGHVLQSFPSTFPPGHPKQYILKLQNVHLLWNYRFKAIAGPLLMAVAQVGHIM